MWRPRICLWQVWFLLRHHNNRHKCVSTYFCLVLIIYHRAFLCVAMPDICLFWYTKAIFRPTKGTPKVHKFATKYPKLAQTGQNRPKKKETLISLWRRIVKTGQCLPKYKYKFKNKNKNTNVQIEIQKYNYKYKYKSLYNGELY